MKVPWNRCFLCLSNLTVSMHRSPPAKIIDSEAGQSQKRTNEVNFRMLLRYLLDTRNQNYKEVLQNTFQVINYYPQETEDVWVQQFCYECEYRMKHVAELHVQLEVVQMKLIAALKKIKTVVLKNSKIYGCHDSSQCGVEVFGNWAAKHESRGATSTSKEKERKIIDVLNAFHTAVFEKDKNSVEIPCVLLNKCAYTTDAPVTNTTNGEGSIKTEPLENENADISYTLSPDIGIDDDDDTLYSMSMGDNLLVQSENDLSSDNVQIKRRKMDRDCLHRRVKNKVYLGTEIKPEVGTQLKTKEEPRDAGCSSVSIKVNVEDTKSELVHKIKTNNLVNHTTSKIQRTPKIKNSLKQKGSESVSILPHKKSHKKEAKIPKKRGRKVKVLPSFAKRSNRKGDQKHRHRALFVCSSENCSFTTISPYRFEHHLRDHETSDKNFSCGLCSRSFSGQQHYDFHMATHEGYNKILCDICNKLFVAVQLVDHMKTHKEKVFPCPNCSHCSSNREKYLFHLREHGTKGKSVCDLCDLTFRSRHKLLSHLFETHKVIEKHFCGIGECKKSFLDPENLKLHRKIHTQHFECQICLKRFIDASRLKVHHLRHSGEKPYKCELCTESFVSKANLQTHCIRMHDAAKLKCEICSKEYSCKTSLLVHLVIHDGTGIPCEFPGCGKSYGSKSLWRRHQATHSTERNHICDECGKQFKTSGKLWRHTKIHINDRKYKCPHCDKAFIMKKYLDNHLRIHTGEKPYVCDLCGKAFNQYAALYQHKRKHLGSAAPPVNPDNGRPRIRNSTAGMSVNDTKPDVNEVERGKQYSGYSDVLSESDFSGLSKFNTIQLPINRNASPTQDCTSTSMSTGILDNNVSSTV